MRAYIPIWFIFSGLYLDTNIPIWSIFIKILISLYKVHINKYKYTYKAGRAGCLFRIPPSYFFFWGSRRKKNKGPI